MRAPRHITGPIGSPPTMRWIFGPLSLVIVLGSIGPTARGDFIFAHADHTYRLVAPPPPGAGAAAAAGTLAVGGQAGYLAHIEDAAENAAITSQLLAGIPAADFALTLAPDGGNGAAYVWIGAQDLTVEGTWIWDGDFNGVGPLIGTGMGLGGSWVTAPGAYHNWGTIAGNQREPDNGGGNQDSAGISLNGWPFGTAGQWNDVRSTDA